MPLLKSGMHIRAYIAPLKNLTFWDDIYDIYLDMNHNEQMTSDCRFCVDEQLEQLVLSNTFCKEQISSEELVTALHEFTAMVELKIDDINEHEKQYRMGL